MGVWQDEMKAYILVTAPLKKKDMAHVAVNL